MVILQIVQSDIKRWSRQTSNSEWIPLANPRNNQKSKSEVLMPSISIADRSIKPAEQVSILSLSPTLQQQYKNQLLQLQKTQESIQKLLLLQQQLKTQHQLLQSQAYQPNSFMNTHDEKQALHQSTIRNLQTLPILAPEVLISTVPSVKALPPLFQYENFHSSGLNIKLNKEHQNHHLILNSPTNSEQNNGQTYDELISQNRHENSGKNYDTKEKSRYEMIHRFREQPFQMNYIAPMMNSAQESNNNPQEIQLVYVPAEILTHRGPVELQKSQSRKYPAKYDQNRLEISSTSSPVHNAYEQEFFSQIQEHIKGKNQFSDPEREKDTTKLYTDQMKLEKQTHLHEQVVRKEEEVHNLREAEKKQKELKNIEEISDQRELYKLQDIKKKLGQDDRNLTEFQPKQEDKQSGYEHLFNYVNIKELPQKQENKHDYEPKTGTRSGTINSASFDINGTESYETKQPKSQSQLHDQHLTQIANKISKGFKSRTKPRNKLSNSHSQELYELRDIQLTTPSPNQPPLSIYTKVDISSHYNYQLIDVLKILKSSKSIDVLDDFSTDNPTLFVGPKYLDPTVGYAKFDLPYLSSIENSPIEKKVDKLPFFVAPLSFDPPSGYFKIPFPAPHIGSVIISSVENFEAILKEDKNLNITYLIQPNSYFVNNKPIITDDTIMPMSYLQRSSTSKYDTSSSPIKSSMNWKLMEFYENIPPTETFSVKSEPSYNKERMPNNKLEQTFANKNYYNSNEAITTPEYHSQKSVSIFPFEQTISQSMSLHQEKSITNHNVKPQFINSNVEQNQQRLKDGHDSEQYKQNNERYIIDPKGHAVTNMHYLNPSLNYDEDTQYNLSSHLPAISPQLPGLVNALVEKSDSLSIFPPSTTAIIMPINTTEVPTTYRSKSRYRSRPTTLKTITTTIPSFLRGNSDRGRKPLTRSRSKFITTTDQYSKLSSSKHNEQDSYIPKTTIGNQKYKHGENKIQESTQTQILNLNHRNKQDSYKEFDLPSFDLKNISSQILDNVHANLNISSSTSNNYATSTIVPIASTSPDHMEIFDSTSSLHDFEDIQKSTQIPNHQTSIVYKQVNTEEQPINAFRYKPHESSSISYKKDSYYKPEKMENIMLEPIVTTELSNTQRLHLQDYSPVYHSVSVNDQYEEKGTSKPIYYKSDSNNNNKEEPPFFLPISENKHKDFAYKKTIVEAVSEAADTIINMTITTTTEVPLTIRYRGRNRLNGRTELRKDSVIQTQSNGSQDEYVHFSAVNINSAKPRQRIRSRTRVQQIDHKNSPIQTDGPEYVRIQTASPEQYTIDNTAITQLTKLPETITVSADGTTANESDQSRAQFIKNRQDMYFATRRPMITARITTPPNTDSQRVNNSRIGGMWVGEMKLSKSRSRLRRPGIKRRTTTTTISTIEANEDLSLEEQLSKTVSHELHDIVNMQSNYDYKNPVLYDKNTTSVKITPNQEFLLNYGTAQNFNRHNYDQTQIDGDLPHHYHSTPSIVVSTGRSVSDIYGAESQWSTKLTDNSFQPSSYSLNQEINESNKSLNEQKKKDTDNPQEIITVSSNIPSITVFVTSNSNNIEQKQESLSHFDESVLNKDMMSDFGKKMNSRDEINNTIITPAVATSTRNTIESDLNKNISTTFKKAGLRRRRIRVRVKSTGSRSENVPIAEFQSYNTPFNNLSRETNNFHIFNSITEPTTIIKTIVNPTSSLVESRETENSIFQMSFDKFLDKKHIDSTTLLNRAITMPKKISNSSWTISTIIPEAQNENLTIIKDKNNTIENYFQSSTNLTNTSNIDKDINNNQLLITTEKVIQNTDVIFTTSINQIRVSSTTPKFEETNNNNGKNIIQQINPDDLHKYFSTKSPIFNVYFRNQDKLQNSNFNNDNIDYPKNHRSKWSEVRHLSDKILFNFTKWNDKSLNQMEGDGYINQKKEVNEKPYNVSATDYVNAIFESIKSADEKQNQSAKLETPAISNQNQDSKLFKIEETSNLSKRIKTSLNSSGVSESEVNTSSEQNNTSITTTLESITFNPVVSSVTDKTIGLLKKIPFQTNFGKILKMSTTTKVSHMTEICYRGHCVMSKPKNEDSLN
ncbi:PREDICTED: uncharacterized protein LOC105366706 [Ceratosolen solmsi marchali]|uniref:Uncharacterized protein LOC105366706 n=1 Tax=Ceratosolen solmsi marchali TaxID=326594 RepID=A0AAJ6YSU4_9HYME|nr:PREDICTED: uncharacterized protein LOC105366706 [Ceratosolen solmsi marchali]